MMRRATAARYLDLTAAEFDREVAAGKLPMPIKLGKDEHWSRIALDERLAEMSGQHVQTDWRKNQKAYAA
jgi:hypothetical protein